MVGGQKAAKNTRRNLCMACDWSVLVTLYKLRLSMSYRSLRYHSEIHLYSFFIGYTEEPKHNTEIIVGLFIGADTVHEINLILMY